MPTFRPEKLNGTVKGIVQLTGSTAEEAQIVADHLVLANLSGHGMNGCRGGSDNRKSE